MAAMPSPRPVRPRPSVVVADTLTGTPPSLRVIAAVGKARPVTDNLHRDVARPASGGLQNLPGPVEQHSTTRPCEARVGGTDVAAQIAETSRREQRIADRVRGNIAIGMPGQAALAGPMQSSQVELSLITERMNIDSDADSRHRIVHQAVAGLR
jgi:hypothetical protein